LQQTVQQDAIQIAIDGPAAAGKSTVGSALAAALDCRYLDTGLMYRALTWLALERNMAPSDDRELAGLARQMAFSLSPHRTGALCMNGKPLGDELRASRIDLLVSRVASYPGVRAVLVEQQRRLAAEGCIVLVGRDIGTVVLPAARVKLWISASAEERAARRVREGLSDGDIVDELARIRGRDATDTGRAVSPLRQADDAIVIETDRMSQAEVLTAALQAVAQRLTEPLPPPRFPRHDL